MVLRWAVDEDRGLKRLFLIAIDTPKAIDVFSIDWDLNMIQLTVSHVSHMGCESIDRISDAFLVDGPSLVLVGNNEVCVAQFNGPFNKTFLFPSIILGCCISQQPSVATYDSKTDLICLNSIPLTDTEVSQTTFLPIPQYLSNSVTLLVFRSSTEFVAVTDSLSVLYLRHSHILWSFQLHEKPLSITLLCPGSVAVLSDSSCLVITNHNQTRYDGVTGACYIPSRADTLLVPDNTPSKAFSIRPNDSDSVMKDIPQSSVATQFHTALSAHVAQLKLQVANINNAIGFKKACIRAACRYTSKLSSHVLYTPFQMLNQEIPGLGLSMNNSSTVSSDSIALSHRLYWTNSANKTIYAKCTVTNISNHPLYNISIEPSISAQHDFYHHAQTRWSSSSTANVLPNECVDLYTQMQLDSSSVFLKDSKILIIITYKHSPTDDLYISHTDTHQENTSCLNTLKDEKHIVELIPFLTSSCRVSLKLTRFQSVASLCLMLNFVLFTKLAFKIDQAIIMFDVVEDDVVFFTLYCVDDKCLVDILGRLKSGFDVVDLQTKCL